MVNCFFEIDMNEVPKKGTKRCIKRVENIRDALSTPTQLVSVCINGTNNGSNKK